MAIIDDIILGFENETYQLLSIPYISTQLSYSNIPYLLVDDE